MREKEKKFKGIILFLVVNLIISSMVFSKPAIVVQADTTLKPSLTNQKVEVNTNYKLSLGADIYNDDRYYLQFELPKSGYIDLKLNNWNSKNQEVAYNYEILLLDENDKLIKSIDTLWDDSVANGNYDYRIGLYKGIYKLNIRIAKNYNIDTSLTVDMSVNFTETDYYEKDNIDNNNIRLNTAYKGISNVARDNSDYEDCFRFSTRFTDDLTMEFRYINPADFDGTDRIYFYDESGYLAYYRNMNEFLNLSNGKYSITFSDIPNGTYIAGIVIQRENVEYEIKINGNENLSKDYYIVNNESLDVDNYQSIGTLANKSTSKNTLNTENLNKNSSKLNKESEESEDNEIYMIDKNFKLDKSITKNQLVSNKQNIFTSYVVGNSKNFWVTDFEDYSDYQIITTLKYSGAKCNVWVENGNQLTAEQATSIGKEFDSKIYSSVTNNFAYPSDVDADGKVNILCYDIKDGFNGSGGYVAGYFNPGDLFNQRYSNQCEVFYIDTYPTIFYNNRVDVTRAYSTLAHEFQHMVNFNRSYIIEDNGQMDTWLNEALSMAAEQIYTAEPLLSRINYYNNSEAIKEGRALIEWNDYDVLSNYSLSYLFGQYLRVQANQGNAIFKEILNSGYNDYRVVEEIVKKYINKDMSFVQFTTAFRMALAQKNNVGLYGFKGESGFNLLNYKESIETNISLNGTASVLIPFNNIPKDKGTNIIYQKINIPADNKDTDINNDNKIDIVDLSTMALLYNIPIENKAWINSYDINYDYIIDMYDIVSVSKNL